MGTPELAAILAGQVVVARRHHPELTRSLSHLVQTGRLVAVLPGVYAAPPGESFAVRVQAAMAWDPDAVLTGRAAARAWFWSDLPCPQIDLALGRRHSGFARPGFRFTERKVPPELTARWDGVRMTVPALTALDLCVDLGGDVIDVALRTRAATLPDLWRALELTPDRAGNRLRRDLLNDSRDQPWSPPERRLHRLLRAAGLTGWRANSRVSGPGWRYVPDVIFEAERLALEVDGREHHTDRRTFERDRDRQNRLVLDGWTVLRFTVAMIDDDPDGVVRMVSEGLALCRGRG